MSVKRTVFSSGAERDNYYKLHRVWGTDYAIYHNLPFLNVFGQEGITLNEVERARLKKTSIDYTLCGDDDSPLICVEFDGLQQGVNIGSTYFPSIEAANEWRQEITDLKLRVAHGSNFPYFVVSYKHFKDLPGNVKLTIVDGIIGEVLARKEIGRRFSAGFQPGDAGWAPKDFNALDQETQYEIVQDWVIGVEVEAELEINPISETAARLMHELDIPRFTCEPKTLPEISPISTYLFNSRQALERMREFDSALCCGSKVTIEIPDFGPLEATVMLPNFSTPGFGIGLELTEHIAEIILCEKLRGLRAARTRSAAPS